MHLHRETRDLTGRQITWLPACVRQQNQVPSGHHQVFTPKTLVMSSATKFAMGYGADVSACLVVVLTAGSRPYLYITDVITRNGHAIPQS